MRKNCFYKILLSFIFVAVFASDVSALLYKSDDNVFFVDLSSLWSAEELQPDEVLSLRYEDDSIKISAFTQCANIQCIQAAITKDATHAKANKAKILKNPATNKVISNVDMPQDVSLKIFSAIQNGHELSIAYFLIKDKAYRAEIANMPYADAELALSHLYANKNNMAQGAFTDPTAYAQTKNFTYYLKNLDDYFYRTINFILGYGVQIITAVIYAYILLFIASAVARKITNKKWAAKRTNGADYSIKTNRRYGSLDLFVYLKDSFGRSSVAICDRWGDLFTSFGAILIICPLLGMLFAVHASILNDPTQDAYISTEYILSKGLLVLGIFLFAAGMAINFLLNKKIYVYSDDSRLLFKCVQIDIPFREEYHVYLPHLFYPPPGLLNRPLQILQQILQQKMRSIPFTRNI